MGKRQNRDPASSVLQMGSTCASAEEGCRQSALSTSTRGAGGGATWTDAPSPPRTTPIIAESLSLGSPCRGRWRVSESSSASGCDAPPRTASQDLADRRHPDDGGRCCGVLSCSSPHGSLVWRRNGGSDAEVRPTVAKSATPFLRRALISMATGMGRVMVGNWQAGGGKMSEALYIRHSQSQMSRATRVTEILLSIISKTKYFEISGFDSNILFCKNCLSNKIVFLNIPYISNLHT